MTPPSAFSSGASAAIGLAYIDVVGDSNNAYYQPAFIFSKASDTRLVLASHGRRCRSNMSCAGAAGRFMLKSAW